MRYVGDIYRPPSEAYSLIVQATIGCSHNKCTFCDMYKAKKFRIRPVKEVIEDFRWARTHYRHVERIFLADGDALIMRTEQLLEILQAIQTIFPECTRVASYGSPRSILIKTVEELRLLKENGLGIVYLGLESGNEEILKLINKGETAAEIIRAGQMIREAGILSSVTAISGLGGKQRWENHAVDTAKALSQMNPDYIGLLTLMIRSDAPIMEQCESGVIEPLNPLEVAQETMLLLRELDSEGSVFRSNHASNYLSLRGTLNQDKEKMIAKLMAALDGRLPLKSERFRLL